MKQKIISLLLLAALVIGLLPQGTLSVNAYSGTDIAYTVEGGNLYFDKETGTITDCDESVTKADIPAQIEGVAVTSIGGWAFSVCDKLKSVTIPSGVTNIDCGAFSYCVSLTSLTIPDSVTSIGENAFAESGLTSVTIPDGVTSIEDQTFYGCSSLKSVTIPDSVTSIGEDAFGWSGLTSIHIPDSVTSIGERAFRYCISLTNVTIPDSVTSIGEGAFYGCNNLQAVYFMGNAPALGDDAFKMWDFETQTIINLPGVTLYYIEGKKGWTSPTWNSYPTATWTPAAENSYTDVSEKEWYYDAVQYASQNGLMNGVGNGKFDPEGSITREQMATILFRYAQNKGIETSKRGELSGFADSGNVSSWAKDAVQWTVAEGIINGSDGKLLPQGNASRAQVSAILMRFLENIVKK